MEEFKKLEDVNEIDERHRLMGAMCGFVPTLSGMHEYLEKETLSTRTPDKIKSQFNVARNMALYSYFLYSLAPEVHLKAYILIEQALTIKADSEKDLSFKQLLGVALKEGWISDAGFRHLEAPCPDNQWCKSLVKIVPGLRNLLAHSPGMLVGDCLQRISVCADFINQLFPEPASNQLLKNDAENRAF